MTKPDITIVIPAFNAAKYITEAAVSILEQRGPSLRLMVIDDGSTDETVKIVEGLGDPRIVLLRNERNLGLVPTINRVYPTVETPFLARMDHDDVSLPGRYEKQVHYLCEHPEIDVVGGAMQRFSMSGGGAVDQDVVRPPATPAVLRWYMIFRCPVMNSTFLARTDRLLAAGELDPDFAYSDDCEFWRRTSDSLALANLPDILLRYRVHAEQASQAFREVQERNSKRSLQRLLSARLGREVRWELAEAIQVQESLKKAEVALEAIDLLLAMEREYMRKTRPSAVEVAEITAITTHRVRRLIRAGVLCAPFTALRFLQRWAGRDGLEIPGRLLRHARRSVGIPPKPSSSD